MNEILNSLWARKSCRVYEDKPIAPEDKRTVFEAALQAPSAGNMALYAIIDVTDQALKDRLAITCDNQPFIAAAPMVLIFCADYRRWVDTFVAAGCSPRSPGEGDLMLAACDALIAAQNAVVAAEALGLGSCYIGDILERFEEHREMLKLPDLVLPIAMLCFGYPVQQQKQRTKPARLDAQQIVHQNGYRARSGGELLKALGDQQQKQGVALEQWVQAFCERKYDSDFSREMARSVRAMIDAWCKA